MRNHNNNGDSTLTRIRATFGYSYNSVQPVAHGQDVTAHWKKVVPANPRSKRQPQQTRTVARNVRNNKQTNQPTNQQTNQPTNKQTNQPTNQPTNKQTGSRQTERQTSTRHKGQGHKDLSTYYRNNGCQTTCQNVTMHMKLYKTLTTARGFTCAVLCSA